jgi:hypothetical protein
MQVEKSEPEQRLYHYTSLSGLRGMVEDGALWATNVHYLNDATEVRYAAGLLKTHAQQRIAEVQGNQLKCLTQLIEWIDHGFLLNHMLFVCSLTPNGNLLSQWRAYCPPGQGVSVGFEPMELIDCAETQGFIFIQCTYDLPTQSELIEDLLRGILETAEDMGESSAAARHPTQSYYDAFEAHEDYLLTLAAQMKHPAFSEEAEWRAISGITRNLKDPSIKFRAGTSRLVPYREFKLPKRASGAINIDHVYVGPCPESNLAMNSLTAYLTNRDANPKQGTTYSQIPWRMW